MGEDMTLQTLDIERAAVAEAPAPEAHAATCRLPDAPLAMPVASLDRVRLRDVVVGLLAVRASS